MFKRLREDIDCIAKRDPAARSRWAILLAYPGLHAQLYYRLANRLWRASWHGPALVISYVGRIITGIEIHPGATLGRRVFIDHGTGVVIGETAEVGDDCTLYQGVTLGGTSLDGGKRHPTLGQGVIVGAGAKILGPIIIGDHARVGSNAVVLKPVEPGTTVVGIPAKAVRREKPKDEHAFVAYGTPCDDVPDPVARTLMAMGEEVTMLQRRVEELQNQLADIDRARTAPIVSQPEAEAERLAKG